MIPEATLIPRFKESEKEEADGVWNALKIIDQMLDAAPSALSKAALETGEFGAFGYEKT